MVGTILVSSAGGPAAENVILNLKLARKGLDPFIMGVDMDEKMIELSSADSKVVVPRASNPDGTLNEYYKDRVNTYEPTLFIPQSDAEVYICSKYRDQLPKMILPKHEIIDMCQDKGKLYEYLQGKGITVPPYKNPSKEDIRLLCLSESPNYGVFQNWYPCWVRARHGAGGKAAFVAKSWRDFRNMAEFHRDDNIDWQMVKYLKGKNYSWTSLWNNGELVTSSLKERIKWVYGRIGTTAVGVTVNDNGVNDYCNKIVETLRDDFDQKLTGIMMVDMAQDSDNGKFYITEINSGRLGTVNYCFGYMSKEVYGDERVNFPWLLWKLANNQPLDYNFNRYDALPSGLWWVRHIDMGYKMLKS